MEDKKLTLEVGKAYRMRCGGSVRITDIKSGKDSYEKHYPCTDGILNWSKSGKYVNHTDTAYDLIEEVPFAYGEEVEVVDYDKSWITANYIYTFENIFIKKYIVSINGIEKTFDECRLPQKQEGEIIEYKGKRYKVIEVEEDHD